MAKKLKPVPSGNKGLPKLPKDVRNDMGFFNEGGSVEVDGVMQEHYEQSQTASTKGATNAGQSRGGGAAISGLTFRGIK